MTLFYLWRFYSNLKWRTDVPFFALTLHGYLGSHFSRSEKYHKRWKKWPQSFFTQSAHLFSLFRTFVYVILLWHFVFHLIFRLPHIASHKYKYTYVYIYITVVAIKLRGVEMIPEVQRDSLYVRISKFCFILLRSKL